LSVSYFYPLRIALTCLLSWLTSGKAAMSIYLSHSKKINFWKRSSKVIFLCVIVFVPYFILFFGMVSISWPWRLLFISWTVFLWRWGKWRIITSSSTILRLLLTFGSFSSADGVIVLHECVCLELFAVLHKMNQWKLVLILSIFINLNISLGEIEEEEGEEWLFCYSFWFFIFVIIYKTFCTFR